MDLKSKLVVVAMTPLLIALAIGTMILSYILVPLVIVGAFALLSYTIVKVNKERED